MLAYFAGKEVNKMSEAAMAIARDFRRVDSEHLFLLARSALEAGTTTLALGIIMVLCERGAINSTALASSNANELRLCFQ